MLSMQACRACIEGLRTTCIHVQVKQEVNDDDLGKSLKANHKSL